MTTAAEFKAAVARALVNMTRLDAIVNGDEDDTVVIDSGTVPSIAKMLADLGSAGVLPAGGTTGQHLRKKSGTDFDVEWVDEIATIPLVFDGGGAAIVVARMVDIEFDYAGEIVGWTILGDQSGSITFRLMKDTYANYPAVSGDSITHASTPCEIPSGTPAVKGKSADLTGWTTAFAANDTLRAEITAVSGFQRVTLKLKVKKT